MSQNTRRLTLLRLLLEPVVRVCLRYGFSIQDLIEAAKMSFVTVGQREIAKSGERPNVSRLSILSGLHRRDVTRLLEQSSSESNPFDLLSKVIGQWNLDPRFRTKSGIPRSLSCGGKEDEFAKLVGCISSDLHPGTVLFELERRGLVVRDADSVRLLVSALRSREDELEGIAMLASDVDDLTQAVLANLSYSDPVTLHAKTEFDAIPAHCADSVRAWLLGRGTAWHAEVSAYLAKLDLDLAKKSGNRGSTVKVSFGSFALVSQPAEEVEPPPLPKSPPASSTVRGKTR